MSQIAKPAQQQPQERTIKELLRDPTIVEQFRRALPGHLTAEKFVRVALTALTRTPKLQECTLASLMRCLLDLSAMGLEPDGRRAHLIPYDHNRKGPDGEWTKVTECTLILDYKGIVELVRRSGDVSKLHADVVCEKDEFQYDLGEVRVHRINFREPRGRPYAAYAIATMRDGAVQSAVLSFEEIESIRLRSKSGNKGPWVTDWAEMAKKTAFRRLSKMLVLSPEIREAVECDDDRREELPRTEQQLLSGGGNSALAALLSPEPEVPLGELQDEPAEASP
ncbi:MAG: hypothetical protein EBR82_46790 [Caulobacteraceae bacterium]|nr:hypothetical protein [Caulobacteraceae bacterium]